MGVRRKGCVTCNATSHVGFRIGADFSGQPDDLRLGGSLSGSVQSPEVVKPGASVWHREGSCIRARESLCVPTVHPVGCASEQGQPNPAGRTAYTPVPCTHVIPAVLVAVLPTCPLFAVLLVEPRSQLGVLQWCWAHTRCCHVAHKC